VYTALIASARAGMAADSSLQSFLSGMGIMVAFGMGTVPPFLLIGKLGGLRWMKSRELIYRISSLLMILWNIFHHPGNSLLESGGVVLSLPSGHGVLFPPM
jgi:sulfite exporter TauE/SafE